jgi:putative peptide zinc metalloprotease protein
MFLTLNPIFKMDGYWLLSDLSGLSNLHQQMRDACVNLGKKLLRRPTVERVAFQAHGMRLKVLYVYTVLALVYYAFIGQFIYHSIGAVVNSYPQRAGHLMELIQTTYFTGMTERTLYYAMMLIRESVWPLILATMICFLVYRGGGFVYRMVKSVMAGFTLTISLPRWARLG